MSDEEKNPHRVPLEEDIPHHPSPEEGGAWEYQSNAIKCIVACLLLAAGTYLLGLWG